MELNKFCVAGINYKKADAGLRGLFAVNDDQCTSILKKSGAIGLKEVLILSTCNRTEIYGVTENVDLLIQLLCTETPGDEDTFKQSAYIKAGEEAIEHLFFVGAGLDSQILGDYEIVGQLKKAAKLSKQYNFLGAFSERLVNTVLQASKNVKTNTLLSGGTVSVSFAAAQYIKTHTTGFRQKKILLLGTGKIGSTTCKNLVDYLGTKNITLINRSSEKALELADELGLKATTIASLESEINNSDIIIVATNAEMPLVFASHFKSHHPKLIIDLSIPCNVENAVRNLSGINLVNVDELSKLKDKTLKKRESEIPKAKAIITESLQEFLEWNEMRRLVPILLDLKTKLQGLQSFSAETFLQKETAELKIQRVVNETAGKIKKTNTKGCHYIAAINEFICVA